MKFSKWILSVGLIVGLAGLAVAQTRPGDREAKDSNPGVGSSEVPDATGGPDAFGYTYFDANDGCPVFFQDISQTGTFIISGDDVSGTVNLPFGFDLYGTVYNALQASSNGYISGNLGDTGPDLSNDCPIPTPPSTGFAPRIYILHDDLVVNGGIYAQDFSPCPLVSPNYPGSSLDCTIIQWDNTDYFSGGGTPFAMEAILYDLSWEIVYQYATDVGQHGSSSTEGLMDQTSTVALQYACNAANSIPNNFSICFTHPNGTPVQLESFEAKAASEK